MAKWGPHSEILYVYMEDIQMYTIYNFHIV